MNFSRSGSRGIAMLMVVVAIAILTTLGVEVAYQSRIDLQLAANQRSELQAEYQARGGVALARLILKFQRQLDQMPAPAGLAGLLQQLGGGGAPAGGGAAPSFNLQLWRMAKIDCHLAEALFPEEGTSEQSHRSGCFQVRLSDEEERLNLQKMDGPANESGATALRLLALLSDQRFDFLWNEAGYKADVTPNDAALAVRDWLDEDDTQARLNTSGAGEAFVSGFSAETAPYDRVEPRYRPKNARFDSLDELHLVHGFGERVMAAFRDRITVFPDVNARLNVNTQDPMLLYLAILSVGDPLRPDNRLANPLFVDALIKQILDVRQLSFLGVSVADFVGLVEASGITVDRTLKASPANNRLLGDKSSTYRVLAKGEAGDVQKSLTAVFRLNDGLGQWVYFRED
ncbi:MAG: general secretion pathway protein GspK [Myxococcaceae bacterium]